MDMNQSSVRVGSDERADLSQQDRNNFKRLTAILVASFKRKRT
jgi:hypothetical protein